MVETAQFEAPTLLIFVKLFDEPMLEISGAITAVVEGQGGDTRWDKFAEDQPDACNVVFGLR